MTRAVDPQQWFFFDERERALISDALQILETRSETAHASVSAAVDRLARLAAVLRDSPPLAHSHGLTREGADAFEGLLELLRHANDYDFELHLPTKAVVGQGYLVAKINLFRMLAKNATLREAAGDLATRISFEIGQSLYSKMAEDLFLAILTDPTDAVDVKQGASEMLLRIWDDRLLTEVDDFAPQLEAAWDARNRVRPVLGTMIGSDEVFRLFKEAYDDRFLDFFGQDSVPAEQEAAFEEFVFGLSHEQIRRLRSHMVERGLAVISREDATKLLGDVGPEMLSGNGDPETIYSSFKRRHFHAAHRALTGASGPKKTAEQYVMCAWLERAPGR